MAKTAFKRGGLILEAQWKKLVKCCVWSIALYGAET
jgi:hypothetical protein